MVENVEVDDFAEEHRQYSRYTMYRAKEECSKGIDEFESFKEIKENIEVRLYVSSSL